MTQEQINERMISILEENVTLNRRLVEAVEKLARMADAKDEKNRAIYERDSIQMEARHRVNRRFQKSFDAAAESDNR